MGLFLLQRRILRFAVGGDDPTQDGIYPDPLPGGFDRKQHPPTYFFQLAITTYDY